MTVLRPPSDLTVFAAAEVRAALLAALDETLDETASLVLDLSDVEELDTAGLQLLLLVRREAAARGVGVRCQDPSPDVLATLDLVGLTTALTPKEPR